VVQSLHLLGEMLQQLLLLVPLEQLLNGRGLEELKGAGAWELGSYDQLSMALGVPKGLGFVLSLIT